MFIKYEALITFSYKDSLHSVAHQEALKFNKCAECIFFLMKQ